jgi:hypothetical protein
MTDTRLPQAQIKFRPRTLATPLLERVIEPTDTELSEVARRDLARYYALLDSYRERLRSLVDSAQLSYDDLATIMRVHGGGIAANEEQSGLHGSIAGLLASLADDIAIRSRNRERLRRTREKIDETLPARVANLSLIDKNVLLDAIERAWIDSDRPWHKVLGIPAESRKQP